MKRLSKESSQVDDGDPFESSVNGFRIIGLIQVLDGPDDGSK